MKKTLSIPEKPGVPCPTGTGIPHWRGAESAFVSVAVGALSPDCLHSLWRTQRP